VNMKYLRLSKGLVGLAALAALPCAGLADTFVLRRDNVIPVSFEATLTVKDNRPGDVFFAKVGQTDQLPAGTEFEGRIDRIHPARGNRPSSMDLRFTNIILPDHSRVAFDAAPMPLDDKYITRTGDGRIVAKQNIRQQQNDVLGGAIGGFIVGSILHRRVAGTVIGTMIGIGVAQSDHAKDANVIVTAGDRAGALINADVAIDFNSPNTLPTPPSRYEMNRQLDRGMSGPARGNGRPEAETFVNINLNFRNKDLFFPIDARPYRVGKDVMVPLEPTATQLFLDVDRRPDRTIYVDGKDSNMRLTMNSRSARLDGRHFDLSRTVVERKGVVYVPLDALIPLVKEDVMLNGAKFTGGQ